jgi:hypothetical protein
MKRHNSEMMDQAVERPMALLPHGQFEQKNHRIQGDNKVRNERSAEPGRVIADGDHAGLRKIRNLVIW